MNRFVMAAAVMLAGVASAQAPANDACTAAEVLNISGGAATSTTATNINLTSAALEAPFSCFATSKNSVWYTFTATNSGPYRIETCGSVTNYDTIIQLYSGNSCGALTQVGSGCNDQGSCSPTDASALTLSLTAGTTYWVQVAVYSGVTLSTGMRTNLTVTPPPPPPPNDLCANATVLTPSSTPGTTVASSSVLIQSAIAAAEVTPACSSMKNDVWYTFVAPVSGPYRVDSCSVSNHDTVLALYSGACGSLVPLAGGCNDDGDCSPASATVVRLSAGTTYYVQVAAYSTATLSATSALGARLTLLNEPPADFCSVTSPPLTLNVPVVATTFALDAGFSPALNDAQVGNNACFTGLGQTTSTAPGRDVAYQFRADTAGTYSFRVGAPSTSVNAMVYLTDSCVPVSSAPANYSPPQCIAASNRNSSSSTLSEQVSCVPLAANQTVFVWVDESSLSTAGSSMSLTVTPCTQEPAAANDTPATASALSCEVTGSLSTTSDVDFYAVGAPPAGSRLFALAEGAAANAVNFDMRLTTDTRTVEYDDQNLTPQFGDTAPVIAGAVLPGGPTYLRINYNSATAAEPYVLYSTLQLGAPVAEVEPNDTNATATTGGSYFTGSIADGGTDVDYFGFTAAAGDTVFAALDAVPDKTDAGTGTFNFTMSLENSSGATLVSADDTSNTITTTATNTILTSTAPTFPAEGIVYRVPVSGNYRIRVGKTSGANPNPYLLSISVGCRDLAPTLTDVSPTSGTPSGGQTITLTGSNFSERTVVRFGTAIAQVVSITPTQLTVTSPIGSSGPVAVSVTNGVGLSASINPGFTYDDPPGVPPNLVSVTPNFGPIDGGTAVTLQGSVFRPDAGVFFDVGGTVVPALNVVWVNAARITATTPAQLEGLADVQVINYDGLVSTLPGGFRFEGPPVVAAITPNTGLTTGSQTITLTGRNFRAGTTVRIGGTLATAVTPAADGLSMTAVTPSATVNGAVDVVVRTTDGQNTTVTGGFTYIYPAPTIATVTPNRGAITGGQVITIAGTGFVTGPTVTVGGNPATNVTRVSATQVTARTPAGSAAGAVDVTLTNSDAQSVTLTGGYTYQGPPLITSITPNTGLTTGGLTVTITGSALRTGATVRFGTTLGTNVVVAADELSLTVTTPAVVNNGPVDVTVTNVDTQQAVSTGGFTYAWPTPTIAAISPTSGYARGGTAITITGTSFQAGVSVTIGGAPATGIARSGTTQITAVTPAGTPGLANVVVTNTDTQSATLANGFRYVAAPSVVSVSPSHGPMQGGTPITISGMDFQPGTVTVVRLGGVPVFATAVTSTMTITGVTNANMTSGPVDVEVTNPDLQLATLAGGFTYDPSPNLTSLTPLSGSTAGGTVVTLTGSGFLTGATVLFGSVAATNVTVLSNTELTAVTPMEPAGVVSVTVRNQDNQSTELPRAFRFVAPPTITAATPSTGDVLGGTLVHVTGTGFTAGTTVTFGTSAAALVSIVSATELDAVSPRHQPGVVDIKVATDGAEAILTDGFTYTRSAPTLTAVAPASGPIAGGTLLTLNGTGFAPGATITVGGAAATDVVIVSDVLARAVVPPHAAGVVDVVFTNDDNQTTTLAGGFTYVAPPMNNAGTVTDGGTGALGEAPPDQEPGGGVSCGCSSFDGSMFSMAGFGLLMVLSRRRRRS